MNTEEVVEMEHREARQVTRCTERRKTDEHYRLHYVQRRMDVNEGTG